LAFEKRHEPLSQRNNVPALSCDGVNVTLWQLDWAHRLASSAIQECSWSRNEHYWVLRPSACSRASWRFLTSRRPSRTHSSNSHDCRPNYLEYGILPHHVIWLAVMKNPGFYYAAGWPILTFRLSFTKVQSYTSVPQRPQVHSPRH